MTKRNKFFNHVLGVIAVISIIGLGAKEFPALTALATYIIGITVIIINKLN